MLLLIGSNILQPLIATESSGRAADISVYSLILKYVQNSENFEIIILLLFLILESSHLPQLVMVHSSRMTTITPTRFIILSEISSRTNKSQ